MSLLNKAFVTYDDEFINQDKSDKYFETFNTTFDWKYNNYKGYKLNRQTCVFADKQIVDDKKNIPDIWGDDVSVKEWTPELLEIKSEIEKKAKELTGKDWNYNIALCNRYLKKNDFIAFHSDKEEIGSTQSISSLSFGIPRTFQYSSYDMLENISLVLTNGSLIYMGENCQENYKHGMKKEDLSKLTNEETLDKYNNTRINITFRIWNYEK